MGLNKLNQVWTLPTRRLQETKEDETDTQIILTKVKGPWGFPGGAVVESLPANAGDTGSCPGPGRSHMPQSG